MGKRVESGPGPPGPGREGGACSLSGRRKEGACSLSDRRESDLNTYDNPPKYEVMKGELSQVANLLGDFNAVDNGNLLIDLPGKIDDDSLGVILKAADIIVCPFKYDRLTIDSTGLFIKILQYMEVKAKIFFLPNNIRTAVRYDTKEQIVNILNTIGEVTDEIPQSVLMEISAKY